MVTIVSYKDYIGIINSFTEEEIREKYGKLIIAQKKTN